MAICIEASRIQTFTVQLEPREFFKKALELETIELLTSQQIEEIAQSYAGIASSRKLGG